MFNRKHNTFRKLRFRRWCRESYAVFLSIKKEVTIGHVARSIAEKALLKTNLLPTIVTDNFVFSQMEYESDSEEILLNLEQQQSHQSTILSNNSIIGVNLEINNLDNKRLIQISLYQPFVFLKMMKRVYLLLQILLLTSFSYLFSQDENIQILNEIEITAIRKDLKLEQSKQLLIIDQKEIEKMAVQSVDELLSYIPGIDIRKRGANGVQADISMRGGSFDQVLVLLNGVNITDPQTGHYNLDIPIDLADIEKIEILQGAAMRNLGPNAFSGAINIVSKKNDDYKLNIRSVYGSNNYSNSTISSFVDKNHFNLFTSFNYKRSDGYRENSDFDMKNSYLYAELMRNKQNKLSFQLATQWKSFGANQFYSLEYPNQFEKTKTFFASATWNYRSEFLSMNSDAYWRQHHDHFELFRDFVGAENYPWYTMHNYHQTDVMGFKTLAKRVWDNSVSSVGVELRNENILSTVLGDDLINKQKVFFENGIYYTKSKNRLVKSVFANQEWFIGNFVVAGGLSLMHTQQFATMLNGGVDLLYRVSKAFQITSSLNTASRLPTFTDLYYQSANQISNPNLQAERAINYELGLQYKHRNWNTSLTGFRRNGHNIIDWIKPYGNEKWESANLLSVSSMGFDISSQFLFDNFVVHSVLLDYSFLTLNKQAENFDSKYALDYLRNKFVFQLRNKLYSNLSLNWSFTHLDRAGNYVDFLTKEIVSYRSVNLLAMKLLWDKNRYSLFMELNNALNQKYVEFGGIEQQGINFNVGFKFSL